MVDKKYSVLMSVYTNENPNYFKASIESMVNQTLPPEEIVIVKDGPITILIMMALLMPLQRKQKPSYL